MIEVELRAPLALPRPKREQPAVEPDADAVERELGARGKVEQADEEEPAQYADTAPEHGCPAQEALARRGRERPRNGPAFFLRGRHLRQGAHCFGRRTHLRILRQRALVRKERNGPAVVYHLTDERIIEILDSMRLLLRDTMRRQANALP